MLTVSRRTVGGLAGLSGLIAVSTACDPLHLGSSEPSAPSADELLVDDVIADVRRARDLATADRKPVLVALHDAHLLALGALPVTASPRPDGVASIAPRDVTTSETTLKTQLTAAALQAHDGALARMLASMSAAVGQHLVMLR